MAAPVKVMYIFLYGGRGGGSERICWRCQCMQIVGGGPPKNFAGGGCEAAHLKLCMRRQLTNLCGGLHERKFARVRRRSHRYLLTTCSTNYMRYTVYILLRRVLLRWATIRLWSFGPAMKYQNSVALKISQWKFKFCLAQFPLRYLGADEF